MSMWQSMKGALTGFGRRGQQRGRTLDQKPRMASKQSRWAADDDTDYGQEKQRSRRKDRQGSRSSKVSKVSRQNDRIRQQKRRSRQKQEVRQRLAQYRKPLPATNLYTNSESYDNMNKLLANDAINYRKNSFLEPGKHAQVYPVDQYFAGVLTNMVADLAPEYSTYMSRLQDARSSMGADEYNKLVNKWDNSGFEAVGIPKKIFSNHPIPTAASVIFKSLLYITRIGRVLAARQMDASQMSRFIENLANNRDISIPVRNAVDIIRANTRPQEWVDSRSRRVTMHSFLNRFSRLSHQKKFDMAIHPEQSSKFSQRGTTNWKKTVPMGSVTDQNIKNAKQLLDSFSLQKGGGGPGMMGLYQSKLQELLGEALYGKEAQNLPPPLPPQQYNLNQQPQQQMTTTLAYQEPLREIEIEDSRSPQEEGQESEEEIEDAPSKMRKGDESSIRVSNQQLQRQAQNGVNGLLQVVSNNPNPPDNPQAAAVPGGPRNIDQGLNVMARSRNPLARSTREERVRRQIAMAGAGGKRVLKDVPKIIQYKPEWDDFKEATLKTYKKIPMQPGYLSAFPHWIAQQAERQKKKLASLVNPVAMKTALVTKDDPTLTVINELDPTLTQWDPNANRWVGPYAQDLQEKAIRKADGLRKQKERSAKILAIQRTKDDIDVPAFISAIVKANKDVLGGEGFGPLTLKGAGNFAGRWYDPYTRRVRQLPPASQKFVNPFVAQQRLGYIEAAILNKWNQIQHLLVQQNKIGGKDGAEVAKQKAWEDLQLKRVQRGVNPTRNIITMNAIITNTIQRYNLYPGGDLDKIHPNGSHIILSYVPPDKLRQIFRMQHPVAIFDKKATIDDPVLKAQGQARIKAWRDAITAAYNNAEAAISGSGQLQPRDKQRMLVAIARANQTMQNLGSYGAAALRKIAKGLTIPRDITADNAVAIKQKMATLDSALKEFTQYSILGQFDPKNTQLMKEVDKMTRDIKGGAIWNVNEIKQGAASILSTHAKGSIIDALKNPISKDKRLRDYFGGTALAEQTAKGYRMKKNVLANKFKSYTDVPFA